MASTDQAALAARHLFRAVVRFEETTESEVNCVRFKGKLLERNEIKFIFR